MRLFVAVSFSAEVKEILTKAISDLKRQAVSGNFTRPENLHLTLVFIGETNDTAAVQRAMEATLPDSFSLTVGGWGRFKRDKGDIYWAGVEKNPVLTQFAYALSAALRSVGFPVDTREFRPHITIGREVRAEGGIEIDLPRTAMRVTRVSLMKSERINGRLKYTEVFGKPLAERESL